MKNKSSEFTFIENQEIGAFQRFKNTIKNSTFSILFILLKEEEDIDNIIFFAVPVIVDYLQILNFVFHDKIKHLWNSNALFESVLGVFSFFDLSQFYGGVITWNLYVFFFYILIFIILFIIIDIMYVSYSFQRKKFSAIWPLIILRNFVNLAVTLLFLFITETLISMIECPYNSDLQGYYHQNFTDVQCFVGFHLFHTIVSVLFNLIFVIISLIVALNYYESRISSKNQQARSNSRAEVSFIVNKIALQVCFTFFSEEWLLIIIIFLGGSVIAYYYIYDDPFYNKRIGNIFKILSALYLWTCIVLLILKIVSETEFHGGVILWVSPMPFIIFISISFSRHSLKTLLKSQMKFESSEELNNHLSFIIQLIEQQATQKSSYLLLVGYIQKHKEICPEDDCPLKQNVKYKKNDRTDFNETIQQLIQVIYRMYFQGIKKFKNSVTLRIAYAFFLLERLNDKKKALEELSIAQNLKPSFDEEFLIYRYKKIIEDNLNDINQREASNDEEEVDIVGLIAFETHLKTCIHFVQKSAEYHKDFWNELLEEKPQLFKLNLIGKNINFTIKNARENWNKLIKINSNMPSIFKLYGKFLSNILNEQENGEKYLDQFHRIVLKRYDTRENSAIDYDHLIENQAIMFAGFYQNEFGFIKKINKEFTNMFRYTEEEAINQRIEIIMPQLYKLYHQDMINAYIESNNESETEYFTKENEFFGKDKKGFIFQIISQVRPYLSSNLNNQNLMFYDILSFNNKNKNKIFMITNKAGVIQDISSNATFYFDLTLEKITIRRINIDKFLPKALVHHHFRTKGVEKLLDLRDGSKCRSLCFVQPIMMKNILRENVKFQEDNILTGFLIIVEIIQNKYVSSLAIKNFKNETYDPKIDNKTFLYGFSNQLLNRNQEGKIQKTISIQNPNTSDTQTQKKEPTQIITKRLQEGEIIDLYMKKFLFNYQDPVENSDYIQLNVRQSVFKDKLKSLKQQQITSNKKSRKNLLKKIIQKEEKNKMIKFYKFFAFFWMVLLIVINSSKLVITFQTKNEISNQINLINHMIININTFSSLLSQIYDLEYFYRGFSQQTLNQSDKDEYINEKIAEINEQILIIQESLKEFQYFSDDQIQTIVLKVRSVLEAGGIPVDQRTVLGEYVEREGDGTMRPYTHEDAWNAELQEDNPIKIQNQISILKKLKVANQETDTPYTIIEGLSNKTSQTYNNNLTFDDFILYFDYRIRDFIASFLNFINETDQSTSYNINYLDILKEKIINGFQIDYMNESQHLMDLFSKKYNQRFLYNKITTILICSGVFTAISFVLFFIYLIHIVHLKTEKILLLFLDIPRKNLLSIYKKCDIFLKFCTKFTLDKKQQKKLILMSSDDEDEFDKMLNKKLNQVKKKNTQLNNYFYYLVSRKSIIDIFRKSKNKEIKILSYIFLISVCGIIFGILSMYDFSQVQTEIVTYINFIFDIKVLVSQYEICISLQKEIFINSDFKVKGTNVQQYIYNCIQDSIDSNIEMQNYDLLFMNAPQNLQDLFIEIKYINACSQETSEEEVNQCETYSQGTLQKGLQVFEIFLHQIMIQNSTQLYTMSKNDLFYFQEDFQQFVEEQDQLRVNLDELNIEYFQDVETALNDEINRLLGTNTTILIFLLIALIIFLIIVFILVIFPKANELQKQVIVTIQLLNMIPIEVISEINSIREYLSHLARK